MSNVSHQMRPFGKVAVHFAGTVLLLAVLWSTASVYLLDQYERAWGRGGSVQVMWMLSFAMALLALFSSGIGARFAIPQREVPIVFSALGGLFFVAVTAALMWGLSGTPQSLAQFVLLTWLGLAPAAFGFGLIKNFGKVNADG